MYKLSFFILGESVGRTATQKDVWTSCKGLFFSIQVHNSDLEQKWHSPALWRHWTRQAHFIALKVLPLAFNTSNGIFAQWRQEINPNEGGNPVWQVSWQQRFRETFNTQSFLDVSARNHMFGVMLNSGASVPIDSKRLRNNSPHQ